MRVVDRMNEFNRSFNGDAKAVYKKMQHWYKTNNPKDGVFIPSNSVADCSPELSAAISKSSQLFYQTRSAEHNIVQETIRAQCALHLFGTWRNTLGVYRFDGDIIKEVTKAPIPSDTPSHIFARLPDWCVYVQITSDEEAVHAKSRLIGFWALLDRAPSPEGGTNLVLNIVLDATYSDGRKDNSYKPIRMAISESLTVMEAINYIQESNTRLAGSFAASRDAVRDQQQKKILLDILPLLLWLCADEPDISNIKGEPISGSALRAPKYGINKKTGDFVPPSQPITYHLGKRLGGELRQFNDKITESNSIENAGLPTRKRPHIRRGHWHGVWRGTGQDKHFHLNWQAAIFVNGK